MNDPPPSSAETSENRPSGHTLFPLASHTYTQTHTRPSPSLPQSHAFLHELIIPELSCGTKRRLYATCCSACPGMCNTPPHTLYHTTNSSQSFPPPTIPLAFSIFPCILSPDPSVFIPFLTPSSFFLTFAAVENDDIHSVPPHILQNTS